MKLQEEDAAKAQRIISLKERLSKEQSEQSRQSHSFSSFQNFLGEFGQMTAQQQADYIMKLQQEDSAKKQRVKGLKEELRRLEAKAAASSGS